MRLTGHLCLCDIKACCDFITRLSCRGASVAQLTGDLLLRSSIWQENLRLQLTFVSTILFHCRTESSVKCPNKTYTAQVDIFVCVF